jgi:hypothetical protein
MMLHRSKEHAMFPFVRWPHKSPPAGRPRGHKPRRPQRTRLTLEGLEDRLVLNGDVSQLPLTLGGYPASGATHLAVNFDGGQAGPNAPKVTSQNLSDQTIQDVLYRTYEAFAPFNVQVSRLSGIGKIDTSAGATTVFVGANPSKSDYTPDNYTDYPHPSQSLSHAPHSDSYNIAYVNTTTGGASAIVQSLTHEAGHTFGLAHVRSDVGTNGQFQTDANGDTAKYAGTVGDLMGYNNGGANRTFFANQSLPLTLYNYHPEITPPGDQIDSGFQYNYVNNNVTFTPSTQNSFLYLQEVLGSRPVLSAYSVAHSLALDPSVQKTFVPQLDTLVSADSLIQTTGSIAHLGDYVVERWTAPADETIQLTVNATGGPTLNPVLLAYTDASPFTDSLGETTSSMSLTVQAGRTYDFVVGGHDGASTGDFQLTLNQLPSWAQLVGASLEINGNQLGAAREFLSIDATAQGKLVVSLNNLPQQAQFEPGQVMAINVASLGGKNAIYLSPVTQNLSFLPYITIQPGSNTILTEDDIANPAATTYTVTPYTVTRSVGGALPTFAALYNQIAALTVQGGTGNDQFNVQANANAASVTLVAGPGSDTVNVGTAQTLSPIGPLTVDGGGNTALVVNDQANPTSQAPLHKPSTQYTVTGGSLTRTVSYPPSVIGGGSTTVNTIYYQNLTTLTLNAGNNGPNTVDVESTIPGTTNINGGAATSQIDVTPTTQNLDSIAGSLIVSGLGSLKVYDQANPHGAAAGVPTAYDVYSGVTRSVPYAKGATPTTTQIFAFSFQGSLTLYTSTKSPNQVTVSGLPAATTTIDSGSADTITVTAFSVPVLNTLSGTQIVANQLTVNADGGTLTVNDLATQNDTLDTFSDAFTITDQAVVQKETWTKVVHRIKNPEVPINPKFPPPPDGTTLNAYFTYGLYYTNVASLTVDGGPVASSFNVQSTPVGVPVTVNGSTGTIASSNGVKLTQTSTVNQFSVGANGSVKNVRSQLTLHGSGPNDSLLVDDSQATALDNVTVTPTQVGAAATDQFFGGSGASRGSLTYGGLSALTLDLSHAAGDSVQLTPSATTAFTINGDSSEFQTGHGAVLNLDLTGVINALLTPTGPGAGKWTFGNSNRQPVTFTNMAATHAH